MSLKSTKKIRLMVILLHIKLTINALFLLLKTWSCCSHHQKHLLCNCNQKKMGLSVKLAITVKMISECYRLKQQDDVWSSEAASRDQSNTLKSSLPEWMKGGVRTREKCFQQKKYNKNLSANECVPLVHLLLGTQMNLDLLWWCDWFWQSVAASLCCSDSPGHLEEKVSQLESMLKRLQDDLQKVLWLSWTLFSVVMFSVSSMGESAGRKKYWNCSACVSICEIIICIFRGRLLFTCINPPPCQFQSLLAHWGCIKYGYICLVLMYICTATF